MSDLILSWDDLEEDQPLKTASNQDLALKAAKNLQQLDTTEAVAEMESQAANLQVQKELRGIGAINDQNSIGGNALVTNDNIQLQPINVDFSGASTIMARVEKSLAEFKDKFETGARIEAKHKRLINSKMDANQLVPFKYTWAWSMYLDSTEAHWMPTEASGYLQDEQLWKDSTLATSTRNVIRRLCVNYMYSNYIFSADMLVNLYRVITSPEARQYILRQAFEEQAFQHSIRHVIETFDLGKEDIRAMYLDELTFKDRHDYLKPLLKPLSDLSMDTEKEDEIGNLLVYIAIVYCGMKVLFHLVPMMQVVKLNRNNPNMFSGIAQNMSWVLRDIHRQIDFGIRLFNGIVEENPDAYTPQIRQHICSILEKMVVYNEDLLSTLVVDSTDLKEGTLASKWLAGNFLRSVGIETPAKLDVQANVTDGSDWFIDYFFSLNNKDHGKAEVSLSGESGSLDWG